MRSLLYVALLSWAAAAAQPQLAVWTYGPSGTDIRWLQDQAAAFEQETGVAVSVRTFEMGDLRARLTLPALGTPDLVVTVPHDWLPALVEAGAIAPIDGLVDPAVLGSLTPLAREAFTVDGAVVGLPIAIEGVALIHNRALVAEAPRTWDPFVDAARSATREGRFGFLYPFTDPYFSYGWWHASGGYLFAARAGGGWDEADVGLGGEPGYAAARLIRDLRHELGLLPAQSDYGFADGEFLAGRTPMIVNGPWALADYRSVGIDVGVAPVPTPQGAVRPWAPLVGVQGIVIGANATDPAVAAAFASRLAGTDAARAHRDVGGIRIPASDLAGLPEDPLVAAFAAVLAEGVVMPATPALDAAWAPWRSAIALAAATADADVVRVIDDLEEELLR
jgi:maltose-binding protein MalE